MLAQGISLMDGIQSRQLYGGGGVAPGAKLYALKIPAADGYFYDADIIEATEWCITHQHDDPQNPITIINMSFGGGEYTGDCDNYNPYMEIGAQSVSNVIEAGISIFAASGNEGYRDAMSAPACYSGVIAVGEVYDANIGFSGPWDIAGGSCTNYITYPDMVTCYSNSSSTLDLLSPGREAYTLDVLEGIGKDNGDYFPYFGGTSAASPYAAGSAALIQSFSINYRGEYYTPSELVGLMSVSGDPVTDYKNNFTTPRINIDKAFQWIFQWIVPGDINNDGAVDLLDAILPLQVLTHTNLQNNITLIGDVDNNSKIGIEEAIFALRSVAGMTFGTVTSAGQIWMGRNLGASRVALSSTDIVAYGDLYQWGRLTDGHEKRTSPITSTNSTTDVPGHGSFITEPDSPRDWRTPQNDDLWQGVSGNNNPCPSGFRLPTGAELDAERLSWSSQDYAGAFASPLKLVKAGVRYTYDGKLAHEGSLSHYWSSTVSTVDGRSRYLYFSAANASVSYFPRGFGFSVRCLKD